EQLALSVISLLGDHCAVQVQQQDIASRRLRDDRVDDVLVGIRLHASARIGGRVNGRHDLRALFPGKVDECRHGRALAEVGIIGVEAVSRARRAERLARYRHGRKRVRLFIHACNQDFRTAPPLEAPATPAARKMACRSTLQPASRCSGRASSISLWLMPSLQGTKIIAVGATRARYTASCPAPLITGMALMPIARAQLST